MKIELTEWTVVALVAGLAILGIIGAVSYNNYLTATDAVGDHATVIVSP